jgi:hypothetical protein
MAQTDWTNIRTETGGRKKLRANAAVRAAASLTNSYVASNQVDISLFGTLSVMFAVTQGALVSVSYKMQQSLDGSTWFDIGAESVGLSTITDGKPEYLRTLGGNENWYKNFKAIGKYARVQVKGDSTDATSSCTINIVGVY